MVSPSQDLPSDAQALLHDFQSLLLRERKFKPDRRPQERETLDGKERVVLAMRRCVARRGAFALAFIGRSGRSDIDHGDELWGGTCRTVGIGIRGRWSRIGVPLYICSRRARARARGVVVVMTHDGRRDVDRGRRRGVPVRSGSAAPVQGGTKPAQVVVHPDDENEQDER
jgi:hypothetical protein